jgi:hypothetical protein
MSIIALIIMLITHLALGFSEDDTDNGEVTA